MGAEAAGTVGRATVGKGTGGKGTGGKGTGGKGTVGKGAPVRPFTHAMSVWDVPVAPVPGAPPGGAPPVHSATGVTWKADRGRLYRFHRPRITVIVPWPGTQCWTTPDGEQWRSGSPRVRVDVAEPAPLPGAPPIGWPERFEAPAWASVPADVRARVLRASLKGRQWDTLSLLSRCPGAEGLVDDQPLLCAAAAAMTTLQRLRGWATYPDRWRRVRAALAERRGVDARAALASLLGWPTDRAMFRVLGAVGPLAVEAWDPEPLSWMGHIWWVDTLRKVLLHGPPLTIGRVAALSAACRLFDWADGLPARLLLDLDDEADGQRLAAAFTELRLLHEQGHPLPSPQGLRSVAAVEAALNALQWEAMRLPPPPVEAPDWLQPLGSVAELVAEGRRMGHCIGRGGYDALARARQGYGWRVLDAAGAGVATLWLGWAPREPGEPPALRVSDLKGPGNAPVPEALAARVRIWVEDVNVDLLCDFFVNGGEPPERLHPAWRDAARTAGLRPVGGGDGDGGGAPFADEIPF